MRREGLEIAVEVGLAVLGVDEVMEAIAGGVVGFSYSMTTRLCVRSWSGREPEAMAAVVGLHAGCR